MVNTTWTKSDLAKAKVAYTLTCKKDELLLKKGMLDYMSKKSGDPIEEITDLENLIAKVYSEILEANPLMHITNKSDGSSSLIKCKDLPGLLSERANIQMDYWPSHFATKAEYFDWLRSED